MCPTDNQRPDPDALLAQVQAQERRAARGKLRIYFGASAGVGKTYAMLAAARKLQAVLDGLHARSSFTYLQDKTHFDLYAKGDDRLALHKQISWDMYALARPKSAMKAPR